MARHEFGMMPQAPAAGQRFEKYEPGKYRCIPVEDDEIDGCCPKRWGCRCTGTRWTAGQGTMLYRYHTDTARRRCRGCGKR